MDSEIPLNDHNLRTQRARTSLHGLSVGDAFGEQFFGLPARVNPRLADRLLPPPTWPYTDDTAMAMSVVDVLEQQGHIDQDALAARFAARLQEEPDRGYGAGARQLLRSLVDGISWRELAPAMFGGAGSHGNGAAMRAAPIGAWFSDAIDRVVSEATASAEITHAHPDGIAGAIAVAVAAAFAAQRRGTARTDADTSLLAFVEAHVPAGEVRLGIHKALVMAPETTVEQAVAALGSGVRVSAADTVPFALWCASRHLDNYEEAIWTTVSGLGDRDTTCAIVGGIVVLNTGIDSIPAVWMSSREELGLQYHPGSQDADAANSPESLSESAPESLSESAPESLSESAPESLSESAPESASS